MSLTAVATDMVALTATTNYNNTSGVLAIYEEDSLDGADKVAFTHASTVSATAIPRNTSGRYVAVISSAYAVSNTWNPSGAWLGVSQWVETPAWSVMMAGEDTAVTNYVYGQSINGVTTGSYVEIFDLGNQNQYYTYTGWCGSTDSGTTCVRSKSTMIGPFVAIVGASISNLPYPGNLYAGSPLWSNPTAGTSALEDCTQCQDGDPVNTATGAFGADFTDVDVPGRGVGLGWSRNFSSTNTSTTGWFGPGWTSTYEARLLITDLDGSSGARVRATFVDPAGGRVTFAQRPDNTFGAGQSIYGGLERRADGSYKLSDWRRRLAWIFDPNGVLQSVTDANGETTALSYTGGRLSQVTDSSGRSLNVTWTGNQLTAITDPLGRSHAYTYTAAGELASATDTRGVTSTMTYDSGHRILKLTSARGGYVKNTYTSGKVTKQEVLKSGTTARTSTFSYTGDPSTPAGSTTTVTDDHGVQTRYVYSKLQVQSITRAVGTPAEATVAYQRNSSNFLPTRITDPMGNATELTYGALGRVVKAIDPLGRVSVAAYNDQGQVTCQVDARQYATGVRCPSGSGGLPSGAWGASYDSAGNPVSITDANGHTTSYTYEDSTHPGDVTSVTDPEGRQATLGYDSYGNVATVVATPHTGQSLISQTVYNADSQPTCTVTPRAYGTGVRCPAPGATVPAGASGATYDSQGRVSATVNPKGGQTTFGYDADGNLTSLTDSQGTTNYAYDLAGRLTQVTNGAGTSAAQSTTYAYDIAAAAGATACDSTTIPTAVWCVSVTDNAGKTSTDYYTARGQLAALKSPGALWHTYTYRTDGRPTVVTLPGARTLTATYDDAGQLTQIDSSQTGTGPVSYTYWPNGLRHTMTDPTGTSNYAYDAAGRMTQTTDGAGHTIGYAWDDSDLLTTIDYPSGRVVTRTYDQAGRFTSVADGAGHTTTFTFDGDDNLTGIDYPNGDDLAVTRDDLGGVLTQDLTDTGGTSLSALTWTRDNYSSIGSETGTGAGAAPTTSYGYDPTWRLTSAGGGSYGYDTGNHPTSLAAASQTYTSDGSGQLATSTATGTSRSYAYTNGDLTATAITSGSGTPTTMAYDGADRMTSHARAGNTTNYSYDGDGLRTSTTRPTGTTTDYLYDRSSGVPVLLTEGDTDYIYGPDGLPVEQITTTNTNPGYFVHDQHGDTRVLTGSTGAVTAAYTYTPHGIPTQTTGTASTTLLYGAGHYDTETGYHYLINRYYDPTTGQFTTPDPLLALTGTPYNYGNNNPLATRDALGLNPSGSQGAAGPEPLLDKSLRVAGATAAGGPYYRSLWMQHVEETTGPVSPSFAMRLSGVAGAGSGLVGQAILDRNRTDLSRPQQFVRLIVGSGVGASAATAGMMIGTVMFPGAGTVAGAVVGAGVGAGVSWLLGHALDYATDNYCTPRAVLGDWDAYH